MSSAAAKKEVLGAERMSAGSGVEIEVRSCRLVAVVPDVGVSLKAHMNYDCSCSCSGYQTGR